MIMNQGDAFAFKAIDGNYKAIICTSVYKESSPHTYRFAALTYSKPEVPSINDIIDSDFFGVANTKEGHFKYSNEALNKMWGIYTGMKPYYVGAYGFIIWRKDLQKFKSELIYIGNLKILDNIDKNGNGGVNASSWPFLQSFFNDQIKVTLNGRGQKTFKVTSILSE
jgi:hypothetical protein